jgi:hypothetical protein
MELSAGEKRWVSVSEITNAASDAPRIPIETTR